MGFFKQQRQPGSPPKLYRNIKQSNQILSPKPLDDGNEFSFFFVHSNTPRFIRLIE